MIDKKGAFTHLSRLPYAGGDRQDRGDRDDDGKLPVHLDGPQDHRVGLEQVERVQSLCEERYMV